MFSQQTKGSAVRPALALAAVLVAFFAAAAPAAAEDAPSDRALACLAEAVYYEARGDPPKAAPRSPMSS